MNEKFDQPAHLQPEAGGKTLTYCPDGSWKGANVDIRCNSQQEGLRQWVEFDPPGDSHLMAAFRFSHQQLHQDITGADHSSSHLRLLPAPPGELNGGLGLLSATQLSLVMSLAVRTQQAERETNSWHTWQVTARNST